MARHKTFKARVSPQYPPRDKLFADTPATVLLLSADSRFFHSFGHYGLGPGAFFFRCLFFFSPLTVIFLFVSPAFALILTPPVSPRIQNSSPDGADTRTILFLFPRPILPPLLLGLDSPLAPPGKFGDCGDGFLEIQLAPFFFIPKTRPFFPPSPPCPSRFPLPPPALHTRPTRGLSEFVRDFFPPAIFRRQYSPFLYFDSLVSFHPLVLRKSVGGKLFWLPSRIPPPPLR